MSYNKKKVVANIDRLNSFMDQNGLAAVVARSGQNFTYLSGMVYPGTLARLQDLTDCERAVLLLWPRNGEPAIISNEIAAGLARRDSWVERVELHAGYVESPYDKLCEVIREYGLEHERVGFEKNYVSAYHWEKIQKNLPNMQMVDCVDMMDLVRWVKTPGEIALIKAGADALDDVFFDVFPQIRVGSTERDAHGLMIHECLKHGAGWAHGILNSDTNTIPYAGEGDTVFNKGDVIRTDYVGFWQGYPGHQSRNLVFGKLSPEQDYEYKTNRDIYLKTIDRCRPGVRAGDLFDFVLQEFQAVGWDYKTILIGHGVGAWWHQQEPILCRGSDHILEEGMVLALEPHKQHWHIQDMIVVRDGAPELISDKYPTEQPFIAE
jgi:Xaa-Pro aminopeptidase